MAYTVENALDDPDIHLETRDDDRGNYEFRVGDLGVVVSVKVGRLPGGNEAFYTRSHNIHTPVQAGPYVQSRGQWDDVPYALHQAVSSLTSYYRKAIEAGHAPDDSWLVPSRA